MTITMGSDSAVEDRVPWPADFDEPLHLNEDTSAGKALSLLDAFAGRETVLGVTTLAERAEISKSTAHRLLRVLVTHGYVHRVGRRYCLTDRVFEIGNQVPACHRNGIREISRPYLGELFAQTRQVVHLAVLSGTDVLYLDKLLGHDAARCPTAVGGRRPAYTTALGKAMLAFSGSDAIESNLRVRFRRHTPYTLVTAAQVQRCLQRVRSDGVATDHEEALMGVNCIAAPIIDPASGSAIAAISISSMSAAVEQRYGRALLRVTDALSRLCVSES